MMLSRITNNHVLTRLGSRSFFDYLKIANQVDQGISIEEQQKQQDSKDKSNAASSFSWEWTKWFEKNAASEFPKVMNLRNEIQKYENYSSRAGASANTKSINFDEYRKKIADPTFVDNIEIDYYVNKNTLESIQNMNTLMKWDKQAVENFQKECGDAGYLLMKPLTEDKILANNETIQKAAQEDLKNKELINELQKDFEQFDAERMMFGKHSFTMKLAENPQVAENMEDLLSGSSSVSDYNMLPIWIDTIKRQRLIQIQDENQRKLFLERFETASSLQNGLDSAYN